MSAVIASKDEKPEKPVVVKEEEVKPEVKSEEVVEKTEEVAVKEEEKPEEVVVKPEEVENTEVVEKPEEATEKPEEVMENTEVIEKPEEQIKEEPLELLEPLEPLAVAPELLAALTVGPHSPLNPRSTRWCWSPPRSPDPRANSPPSLLAPPTPMKRPSI